MQKSLTRKLLQNGVLLSLFLHLLFLLGTTTIIIFPAKKPEKHYVPSYVYSGSITPSPASHATPVESVSKPKQVVEKTLESPQAKNSFLPKKNIVYE
ncbi:MAG: hypothetical protein ABI597_00570, partial [Gammaproteobacteria bacterium]